MTMSLSQTFPLRLPPPACAHEGASEVTHPPQVGDSVGPGPVSQGHHELRKDQTQGLHDSIKVLLKGIILSLFSCSEVYGQQTL